METGIISSSEIIDASFALAFGSITVFMPSSFAYIHIGNIPFVLFIFPSSDNSPIKIVLGILSILIFEMHPIAINIPSSHCQIKATSFFSNIGRSQIN